MIKTLSKILLDKDTNSDTQTAIILCHRLLIPADKFLENLFYQYILQAEDIVTRELKKELVSKKMNRPRKLPHVSKGNQYQSDSGMKYNYSIDNLKMAERQKEFANIRRCDSKHEVTKKPYHCKTRTITAYRKTIQLASPNGSSTSTNPGKFLAIKNVSENSGRPYVCHAYTSFMPCAYVTRIPDKSHSGNCHTFTTHILPVYHEFATRMWLYLYVCQWQTVP